MASGSMDVKLEGYAKLCNNLKALNKDSETVIKRTTSDFKSRAPAWISQAVTDTYNIKKAEVKDAISGTGSAGKVKVSGVMVDNVQITYTGRLLTPVHFGMKPKTPPRGSGKKASKSYTLKATILKGKTETIGRYSATRTPGGPFAQKSHNILMGTGSAKADGTAYIPFQRMSSDRGDIKKLTTVSIPQMITNETVAAQIQKNIDENLTKRLDNHMKRVLK